MYINITPVTMRSTSIFLVAISSLLFCLLSCSRDLRSAREAARFMESRITIPRYLLKIENGTVSDYYYSYSLPLLIQYYGPDACSECVLARIKDNYELIEWGRTSHLFETMIIMSPKEQEKEEIINKLVCLKGEYPVFIDVHSVIAHQNVVPSDSRFHMFLVDYSGKPICIGNPLKSPTARSRFLKQIYNN